MQNPWLIAIWYVAVKQKKHKRKRGYIKKGWHFIDLYHQIHEINNEALAQTLLYSFYLYFFEISLVNYHVRGQFIKKMLFQYRNSHYKDKTVSRPSYLYNENHKTWKGCLYIETGSWCRLPRANIANSVAMLSGTMRLVARYVLQDIKHTLLIWYLGPVSI